LATGDQSLAQESLGVSFFVMIDQINQKFSTNYRPHIQGLRAIAIGGVVLFHFGVNQLSGGFVGVDVFFVISGFLISTSISKHMQDGNFSFVEFYRRRIRRILPASLFTIILASIPAFLLLGPLQLVEYCRSALASLVYTPNIYFYLTSDYFAPAAIEMPLLHYWSLGVEEQFYLVYPVLVYAITRYLPKAMAWVLGSLLLVSFAAEVWITKSNPLAAFYLLPFRGFELLTGCLLSQINARFALSPKLSGYVVGLGLATIFGAMLLIDEKMAFPGLLALIPCLGAALVIFGADRSDSLPARAISTAPFKFIGAISYSLYLVHWPIVVYWNNIAPNSNSLFKIALALGASIVLAALSYQFVEQPFIQRRLSGRLVFLSLAPVNVVLAIAAVSTLAKGGFPSRFNDGAQKIMANLDRVGYLGGFRKGVCFIDADNKVAEFDVEKCAGPQNAALALWGDSAIAHLYFGLSPLMAARGLFLSQFTSSGCPPVVDYDVPPRPNCLPFNRLALKLILERKPQKVVLGSSWPDGVLPSLDKTIAILRDAGIAVVVLGPPEQFKRAAPTILIDRRQKGNWSIIPGDDLDRSHAVDLDRTLSDHFRGSGVKYVSSTKVVCGSAEKCIMAIGDIPIYFDVFHLTTVGSIYYGERLITELLSK
jgi:peptidoglycan/LPS O-acetylase OafA/YrhL